MLPMAPPSNVRRPLVRLMHVSPADACRCIMWLRPVGRQPADHGTGSEIVDVEAGFGFDDVVLLRYQGEVPPFARPVWRPRRAPSPTCTASSRSRPRSGGSPW